MDGKVTSDLKDSLQPFDHNTTHTNIFILLLHSHTLNGSLDAAHAQLAVLVRLVLGYIVGVFLNGTLLGVLLTSDS